MNPHPTKSKPCKIGRKHTGAQGIRTLGRRARVANINRKIRLKKFREFKLGVAAYWRGELDQYPKQ